MADCVSRRTEVRTMGERPGLGRNSPFQNVRPGRSGIVKGFRMPAGDRTEWLHGGRRPKSLEGGNRGGARTDADVDLWGICRRCLI
jgi:hypothetical protein